VLVCLGPEAVRRNLEPSEAGTAVSSHSGIA
jgi:hypothetical protein